MGRAPGRLRSPAGRNLAMIAASLAALVSQRPAWFLLLCLMGLVREAFDGYLALRFRGLGPEALGLATFVGIWVLALAALRRRLSSIDREERRR